MSLAVLCLVTDDTDPATLKVMGQRTADLDAQRDRALEKALTPDVVDDLRETVDQVLARLARNPGTPLRAILYDLGRHMYVAGRMDQAQDDRVATAQAEALAEGALAQITSLVERRAKAGA